MTRSIDYGKLMHRAMRNLIQQVLLDVCDHGLPGTHHFFITFDTTHPDTRLADWLRERYPNEMTVVMQHWFDHLEVTDDGFSVTLNFGDAPENLFVPYDAIQTFVDPSVEFGLRFESHDEKEDGALPFSADNGNDDQEPAKDASESEKTDAQVVSLDSFRK